jgi:hypothetical protein
MSSAVDCRARVEDPYAFYEISPVSLSLEADERVACQLVKDLLPPGKLHENVQAWEGDVQEERRPQVGVFIQKHRSQRNKLIVVDPDKIVFRGMSVNDFGKFFVCSDISLPVFGQKIAP